MKPARLLCLAALSLTALLSTARAQDFINTTINPGTNYASNGLGVYDLSGGSLVLSGSAVLGDGTVITWAIPQTGGILDFGTDHLKVTDGNVTLKGDPVAFPSGFTLDVENGSLIIDDPTLNLPAGGGQISGVTVIVDGNPGTILGSGTISGITVGDGGTITVPPGSVMTVPEPSTWALLLIGATALVARARRRAV